MVVVGKGRGLIVEDDVGIKRIFCTAWSGSNFVKVAPEMGFTGIDCKLAVDMFFFVVVVKVVVTTFEGSFLLLMLLLLFVVEICGTQINWPSLPTLSVWIVLTGIFMWSFVVIFVEADEPPVIILPAFRDVKIIDF